MKTMIGEYNVYGYRLLVDNEETYSAGNACFDSASRVDPKDKTCVPLKKIRQFCIQTGKDECKENGYKWGGAEKVEDEIDCV